LFTKKNKLSFVLIFLLISILFGLNKTTTQRIGIDYEVRDYQIPLYLKLYNFYGRHLNYKFLVNEITKNSDSDLYKVLDISKWLNNNIKKVPKGVEVIDSHPLTIVDRRLGTKDQFSDLLSVMLVYAGIDSFFWVENKRSILELNTFIERYPKTLTFFKLNESWSIIDPYYGVVFFNRRGKIASIQELKNEDWELFTFELQPIDVKNFISIFYNHFDNFKQVKEYYMKQFSLIPTQEMINMTNTFELGGRSYIQSPLGRLKFVFWRL